MRPAAHHTARWSQQLRTTSRTRKPVVQQRSSFHLSTCRCSDSKPPNGAPDHRTSHDEKGADRRDSQDAAASKQTNAKLEDGESKAGVEALKPGLRKGWRQRRVAEVPKPPPIPQWFLEQNVKLRIDDLGVFEAGGRRQLQCIDMRTSHALFHLPYNETPPGVDLLNSLEAEGVADAFNIDTHFAELLVESYKALRDRQRMLLGEREGKGSSAMLRHVPQKHKSPDQTYRDWVEDRLRLVDLEAGSTADKSTPTASDAQRGPVTKPSPDTFNAWRNLLISSFLEIESSARAAMSLARQNLPSASFAASRVDISVIFPDSFAHQRMEAFVQELASVLHADLVVLDASDIAELTDEYVGQCNDSPGSFATLGFDVFEGHEPPDLVKPPTRQPVDAADEDEIDGEEERVPANGIQGIFSSLDDLRKSLSAPRSELAKMLSGKFLALSVDLPPMGSSARRKMGSNLQADYVRWDDARLGALLDSLLDAPRAKGSGNSTTSPAWRLLKCTTLDRTRISLGAKAKAQREILGLPTDLASWLRSAASYVATPFRSVNDCSSPTELAYCCIQSSDPTTYASITADAQQQRTIVHVRDLKNIRESRLGDAIVRRLVRVVQKRRRSGEEVLVIGTTAQDVDKIAERSILEGEDSLFRNVAVPPLMDLMPADFRRYLRTAYTLTGDSLSQEYSPRILEINARHIERVLQRLQPESSQQPPTGALPFRMPYTLKLGAQILSLDEVQALVLTAIGLSQLHAKSGTVQPVHIALAMHMRGTAAHALEQWQLSKISGSQQSDPHSDSRDKAHHKTGSTEATAGKAHIAKDKWDYDAHEKRLLSGVVDATNIKTGFADVHAAPETIEALKTLTTLSLQRPDAFKYGVLANDRLPGLLLYGPPGTGKTLLAKAVAKESQATVLEVSGAQIYEKYVGEGEKMVRAIFSLAKKRSPCIVFIDEADAIFGSRGNAANRTTHRQVINQFLRGWDGMDDHNVFMMVATNRPFDLDDAVLRRLPRRLLVDLPVAKDREAILGIHLKHENLDDSVSLSTLAEQTPLYSGSDLKNLTVAAALAAVREENDLVQAHKGDEDFKLAEKRTLTAKHFEKATAEISASISEEMSSLNAIRKFDEQFGDRRGRRKKAGYGFGLAGGSVESAARVRQHPPPP